MEVVLATAAQQLAVIAADEVEQLLLSSSKPVLGLATGSSPLPIYNELIKRHRSEGLSFRHATAFLLDEYVGLQPGCPQSYRSVIEQEFTSHIDLPASALAGPQPNAEDPARSGPDYERLIAQSGGIDLQILGVGSDGHIAFNEPSSSLASRTRFKTLTDQTIEDNARFFDDDADAVPRHVLTQGVGTILEARHLVLIACGPGKAAAIAALVEGPVTAMCPASALQLHPKVTVLVDELAASELKQREYYRSAYRHKPAWQMAGS